MNRFDEWIKNRANARFMFCVVLIIVMVTSIACQKPIAIRIGVIGTMTGPNSDLSVSGRRGVEMAINEINQRGGIDGKTVELIVKDDRNDPQVALKMGQEFITEGIRLVIGPYTSGMVVSSMDYINSQDMLMLSPTVSADNLSGMDDNFIRFIASTKEQAIVLINVAEKLHQNQITILYDERNKGFTDQLVLNYQTLLKEKMGTEATILSFNPQKPETLDQALEAVKIDVPQGLFVIASAEDCAKVAQKIKPAIPELQLYGPLWANTAELIRKGGIAVEGMIIVGGIDFENQSEKYKAFNKNFNDRYGEEPTFSSMYSYETMLALVRAIEEANSQKPAEVKKKLMEISKFEGVQEQYSLDSFGDNTRRYQVFMIRQGSLRKVE